MYPVFHEVWDDALRRTLGDVEQRSDLPNPESRISRDEEERIAMVGEEPEVRRRAQRFGCLYLVHDQQFIHAVLYLPVEVYRNTIRCWSIPVNKHLYNLDVGQIQVGFEVAQATQAVP
jgi:hypothetical protein